MKKSSDLPDQIVEVLTECRENVLDAAPKIFDAIIKKAAAGSYQHAKFLFDFLDAGLPANREGDDDHVPGPSLAEILLERLELMNLPPGEAASPSAGA